MMIRSLRLFLPAPSLPPALLWFSLARERRALEALDARLLRDIGVTPTAARREAARWPWDAPAGR